MENEPVRIVTLIMGLVAATLTLLAEFGASISPDQSTAIYNWVMAAVVLASFLGAGQWLRSKVTPTANPHDEKGNELSAVATSGGVSEQSGA